MSLTSDDIDFARSARATLLETETHNLLDVLNVCELAINRLTDEKPSRQGAIAATIYMVAAAGIVAELERRENPNGDVQ